MPQGVPVFPREAKYKCENCCAQSTHAGLCWRCNEIDQKKPVFDRAHKRRVEDEFGELDFNRS